MFNYMLAVLHGLAPRMKSEKGATAVEYGIMVAAIAVVIIVVVFALGDNLVELFQGVGDEVGDRVPAAPAGGEGA